MLQRLKDVFRSFADRDVRYVVIGGIAAVMHGVPRATFDVDLLIDPTLENAERILAALEQAQVGTASLITAQQLLANEITVFSDRVRIDVQTFTPGLAFEQAWRNRVTMSFEGQSFFVASKEDLIASKRAAGRAIDLSDIGMLEAGPPE